MIHDFRYKIGDKVVIKFNKVHGEILSRKLEYYENGNSSIIKELYFVKYDEYRKQWYSSEQLNLSFELQHEESILKLLIDVNLHRPEFYQYVKQFEEERKAIKKKG